ncbi:WD40/YVTN/BNR-like repeat-containing protein [Roseateles koreensis]|uniref:YCF48-related protein n=1 Tax=Roseateles koreensis TaxID=2987526 RepID=A0ABT5KX39_9BURK|nr:YCF48-related protein [Roseateles koreensis]MDC8786396.1 YCF48-related protein [Roseateles koreensis]
MKKRMSLWAALLASALMLAPGLAFTQSDPASSVAGVLARKALAIKVSAPETNPLLAAARAGNRLVAVGARGMVLLSDDNGKQWRQAAEVPVRSMLTSVSFVDAQRGWAVGHDTSILATTDGGEHWQLQHFDAETDRPLFSVHFFDARQGVAVGLWSTILTTDDAGVNWRQVKAPAPPEGGKADRNLFSLFASPAGAIYAAAERGAVLRSKDRGVSWEYLSTGYKGSLWTGLALDEQTLVVAGMRGTVYRSDDAGAHWASVPSHTQSSVTQLARHGQQMVAVGLDGVMLRSDDQARTLSFAQRDDRLKLTAAITAADGSLHLLSAQGVVLP